MDLINSHIQNQLNQQIINPLRQNDYTTALSHMAKIYEVLYKAIPAHRRISYGITYIVKIMGQYIFNNLAADHTHVFEMTEQLFKCCRQTACMGVILQMLSLYGLHDYKSVLRLFRQAASSKDWITREFSQGFFRKIIKQHPLPIKEYLVALAQSPNPYLRRFTAETTRPVVENRWFYHDTDYHLSILSLMFKEKHAYARTSVGNNLSDMARRLPELVLKIVRQLVTSGDKNSYWIACRACRNLVKKQPLRVMDILGVDEYKYKQRVHKRDEYQGNTG